MFCTVTGALDPGAACRPGTLGPRWRDFRPYWAEPGSRTVGDEEVPMQPISASGALIGSAVNLDGTGHYVHWGFIQMSVANLVVIALMIVVFVAAILIPFRVGKAQRRADDRAGPLPGTPPTTLDGDEGQWSAKVR